jgi:hypothetical protein
VTVAGPPASCVYSQSEQAKSTTLFNTSQLGRAKAVPITAQKRRRAHCGHAAQLHVAAARKLNVERVVVRREEQAALPARAHHVLEHRVRDRVAVKRARAAAELVEDDERRGGCAAQDARALGALDHERRLAGDDAVGRADARVDGVGGGERERRCRRGAADLREDGRDACGAQQR